jgi:hypothetical protein
LACGPKASSAARGREPKLGSGSGLVRSKVGDDRWPSPVGDRGRREAEKGLLGRLGGLGGERLLGFGGCNGPSWRCGLKTGCKDSAWPRGESRGHVQTSLEIGMG